VWSSKSLSKLEVVWFLRDEQKYKLAERGKCILGKLLVLIDILQKWYHLCGIADNALQTMLKIKIFTTTFGEMKMTNIAKKIIMTVTIASIVGGCATAGKDVAATYVSPMQFSNYDCDQLRQEMLRTQGRANQLSGRLDQAASNDKAILVGGGLLFWPALFALGGTSQQEAELSRLKGEYDALQSASTMKKCIN
jgi:hypothetical protein